MESLRLWDIYHPEIPEFLAQLAAAPPVQRLRQVGMNCGCEYTRFPQFVNCSPYSRFDHSMGVALIIWHFTGSKAAAAAGLLHDVATPVFAHVIDFLRGDHVKQEATEAGTREIIEGSPEIQTVLHSHGLTTAQAADYRQYPVADNGTPRLSADRLEYTLGNLVNYGFGSREDAQRLYRDIVVLNAPDGAPELGFCSESAALEFAALALRCSRVYTADADRFAMQALAELIRGAADRGVLDESDLYTTEPQVIQKLRNDPVTARRWEEFTRYSRIYAEKTRPVQGLWLQVNAKKRYIDPLTESGKRASVLSSAFARELNDFLALTFEEWLGAE